MSVTTEHPDLTDPAMSPLRHFGKEVRIERERLGISRADLGKAAHCGYSLVAKIEQGERLPALDFAEACDRVFPTAGGRFVRLWPLIIKYAYPSWFRPFVELEAVAMGIRSFQVQVVPGLLQTEAYARAVLGAVRRSAESVEHMVAARLQRQRILARDKPPELWVVLDENVLRRQLGSRAVFAEQLERLLEEGDIPSTVIQVVPFSVGVHAGLEGPFAALTMDEGPDVVYMDGFSRGHILADPADVKAALRVYDLLTAMALSPGASRDLIHSTLKDLSP
ncbi:Helix-turn-helix domain-containing protein [Streptomyces sp. DvalAA-14]|uniref:helix-turn-helix domain-containing protein n=1 Tax=unclassified Streptomyces TaxID=2593676 RepID=UPI00081BA917|nr:MULTISPECIES: helix-turn-helix transcriptional regulator [unclassified Streptomyces]MYS23912.1 helix-turn-helix domain-containing protein [Streptomyces sp. SID4948]SCE40327.1 Helix-turn-helix domain-containing protein [Streptomyces sp. DvalAA-14]